jgi:hypothetical protein
MCKQVSMKVERGRGGSRGDGGIGWAVGPW